MISVVGPGASGKSTIGAALARRLAVPFVDLDRAFMRQFGDISAFIQAHGYESYTNGNVQTYLEVLRSSSPTAVLVLSSGFMTYRADVHPAFVGARRDIADSRTTVVLLPSLDFETCVAETIRRQLTRSFSRAAEREEQVIRSRFALHECLPAAKFETMKPVEAVVDDLMTYLLPTAAAHLARQVA